MHAAHGPVPAKHLRHIRMLDDHRICDQNGPESGTPFVERDKESSWVSRGRDCATGMAWMRLYGPVRVCEP